MKKQNLQRSALIMAALWLVLFAAFWVIARTAQEAGFRENDFMESLRGPKGSVLEGLVPLSLLFVMGLWVGSAALLKRWEHPLQARTVWSGLVSIGVVGIVFMVVYPVYLGSREKSGIASCTSNIKHLDLALLLYMQDWDQALPRANQWASATTVYAKSEAIYQCPEAKSPYGYAFNASLDHLTVGNRVDNVANTVLLFEADAATRNASGTKENLTRQNRHTGYLNYGFLDGHAKRMSSSPHAEIQWQPSLLSQETPP